MTRFTRFTLIGAMIAALVFAVIASASGTWTAPAKIWMTRIHPADQLAGFSPSAYRIAGLILLCCFYLAGFIIRIHRRPDWIPVIICWQFMRRAQGDNLPASQTDVNPSS